jgi:hypothetical protein
MRYLMEGDTSYIRFVTLLLPSYLYLGFLYSGALDLRFAIVLYTSGTSCILTLYTSDTFSHIYKDMGVSIVNTKFAEWGCEVYKYIHEPYRLA